jgi:signal peptidase II
MSATTPAPVRVSGRRGWIRAVLVLGLVLLVDQVSKALVRSSIPVGSKREILPGVLSLLHVRNRGVAFGFLAGGGAVVLAVTGVALAALLTHFALHPSRPLLWLPTGLLLGGAFGNLLDRLRDGAVTDFIHLPHWPSFNLADMAITIGVVSLVFVLDRGADAAAN